jgi:thioredoxin-related protein
MKYMKLKAHRTVAIALLVLVALMSSSMALGQEIQWHTYNDGMARGKFENKRVFIHFWAEWCAACKTMEKNTFSDPDVVAALNEDFIPVKVNADREVTTASMYRVQALPDNWFIAADGEIIGNRPGYIPPDQLKHILKIILSESQADQ